MRERETRAEVVIYILEKVKKKKKKKKKEMLGNLPVTQWYSWTWIGWLLHIQL